MMNDIDLTVRIEPSSLDYAFSVVFETEWSGGGVLIGGVEDAQTLIQKLADTITTIQYEVNIRPGLHREIVI